MKEGVNLVPLTLLSKRRGLQLYVILDLYV